MKCVHALKRADFQSAGIWKEPQVIFTPGPSFFNGFQFQKTPDRYSSIYCSTELYLWIGIMFTVCPNWKYWGVNTIKNNYLLRLGTKYNVFEVPLHTWIDTLWWKSDPSLLKKYQPVVLCSVTIRRISCDYFLLDVDALIWFAVCVDVLMLSDPQSSSDSCGSVLLYQCSTEPKPGLQTTIKAKRIQVFSVKTAAIVSCGTRFFFFFFCFGLIHLFFHDFILIQVWFLGVFFYYYLKDVYVSERRINNKRHIQKCTIFFYM